MLRQMVADSWTGGRRLPNLTAVRAFDAVCRLGTAAAAARELGVTPGAVSRQILALEKSVRIPLFIRRNGRLVPTPEGDSYRESVGSALNLIETATASIEARAKECEISLACPATFNFCWLVSRLPCFERTYPDIRMVVHTELSVQSKFEDLGLDAAINVGVRPSSTSLMQTAFMGTYNGPVLSASLFRSAGEPPGANIFTAVRALKLRSRPHIWEEWSAQSGVALPPTMNEAEFDHMYVSIEAARFGLGVCMAPYEFVWRDIAEGKLVAPLGFQEGPIPCHIAWREVGPKKRALATLITWLKNEGRKTPIPDRVPQLRQAT
jgi:DNA-binding transcriptional LysR family regulator